MPWNGTGTYSPPVASFPEVNGTIIDAGRYNPTITDLGTGITAALAKNGENSPTANLPMGGFKHTGAADGAAAGQYIAFAQATAAYISGNFGIGAAAVSKLSLSGAGHEIRQVGSSSFISGYNTAGSQRNGYIQWLDTGISLTAEGSGNTNIITFGAGGGIKLTLSNDGRLYGTALHNNAGAVTGTTNQYVASGTYTPTLTNVTNVAASTSAKAQWCRVGNVVTVSGRVAIDPTSGGASTQLDISLPIASNLAVVSDLGGTAATSEGGGSPLGAPIMGETVNNRASLVIPGGITTTTNINWSYIFQYEVL